MNTFTDQKVNSWIDNCPDNYLEHLRDTSTARRFCREFIEQECTFHDCKSILEIGVGGLNERIALDEFLKRRKDVTYTGSDWTLKFVEEGGNRFPDSAWRILDIVKGPVYPSESNVCDIVYSQHVIEHCGGLTPALANMLELTKRTLLNIFFLPLQQGADLTNFSQYPRYHNTYSFSHVQKVCEHHGFNALFEAFNNETDPKLETVLIATRK